MTERYVKESELLDWVDENAVPIEDPPPPPTGRFSLLWPALTPKVITQWYGINPQWYRPFGLPGHEGLDFRALNDTPVYAMSSGEVIRVETDPDIANSGPYGIHVRIKHDHPEATFKTIYAHFRRAMVAVGDHVLAGQQIGLADNTGNSSGPHLHISLKRVGQGSPWMNMSDIVNPVPYMLDLFPECRIPGYDLIGWITDVGGNFRTSPETGNNLIRYIPPGKKVGVHDVNREDGGDWWQISFEGIKGWFWNPGYKLRAL